MRALRVSGHPAVVCRLRLPGLRGNAGVGDASGLATLPTLRKADLGDRRYFVPSDSPAIAGQVSRDPARHESKVWR